MKITPRRLWSCPSGTSALIPFPAIYFLFYFFITAEGFHQGFCNFRLFPACLVHSRVGRLTFEIEQKKQYHPSHLMFIFSSDPFPFRALPKLYCMLSVGLWRALLVSMAHTFPACLPPVRYLETRARAAGWGADPWRLPSSLLKEGENAVLPLEKGTFCKNRPPAPQSL